MKYSEDERKLRVVAEGEHSNHAHVLIGGKLDKKGDDLFLIVEKDEIAYQRHILQKQWEKDEQEIKADHDEIQFKEGTYKFVQQKTLNIFKKQSENFKEQERLRLEELKRIEEENKRLKELARLKELEEKAKQKELEEIEKKKRQIENERELENQRRINRRENENRRNEQSEWDRFIQKVYD